MFWLYLILGTLAALVLIPLVIGSFMPRDFEAFAKKHVAAEPQRVWAALNDYRNCPAGGRMCRRVEPLPDVNGLPAWREDLGSSRTRNMVLVSDPPQRLVRRMEDEVIPLRVECEYRVSPADGGCDVTAMARGSIDRGTWHVPFFKFIIHVFGGIRKGQQQYLDAVAARVAK